MELDFSLASLHHLTPLQPSSNMETPFARRAVPLTWAESPPLTLPTNRRGRISVFPLSTDVQLGHTVAEARGDAVGSLRVIYSVVNRGTSVGVKARDGSREGTRR